MNAPVVTSAVVVIPVVEPSTNKVTVLPASAVPLIVGVVSFVVAPDVDIVGLPGAVVSIVNATGSDAVDVFPAASVAVTVKMNAAPCSESEGLVIVKEPSVFAVVDPNSAEPLNSFTVLPASAVPLIVGVVSFVVAPDVVISGLPGAVVSIVNVTASDAVDIFPAVSVALTVKS